ncbi:hypothetical protein LY71_1094 [Geodermatophilus tzadiensis]|uniref:Uncharacterized protein n=1 Tax=Geodermatophilus tzadiensis TaxID=1137988 RepID=A0A2T0TRS8_9ACTN|nr:hypothetical protein [Geodermatophilus tzadiensis]PRY48367.1 hypothetical protein LY71_1094 [Geodermatophilus tzadiensis]
MSRLIDVRPDEDGLPPELVVAVGDVIRVAANGGRIRSGSGVELLGVLSESVVGTDGSVLTPLGAPGAVLLRARSPGRAVVDVITGDPFRAPVTRSVTIRVET